MRLQKNKEPRANEIKHVEKDKEHVCEVTASDLGADYSKLTTCVYESIKAIVPEKKWIKRNGRVVSDEAKKLFERRAEEYKKEKPTSEQRTAQEMEQKDKQCMSKRLQRMGVNMGQ